MNLQAGLGSGYVAGFESILEKCSKVEGQSHVIPWHERVGSNPTLGKCSKAEDKSHVTRPSPKAAKKAVAPLLVIEV